MTENITRPRAEAIDSGVELLLPAGTPLDALRAFVASCNAGACACAETFVARVTEVELFEEPGRLRVRITGDVTPEEVLTEMAASAALDLACRPWTRPAQGTAITHTLIASPAAAAEVPFAGSPTILIDGADLFPSDGRTSDLACRVYLTPAGLAGQPTQEQIQAALDSRG
jgi:hypothetical protein